MGDITPRASQWLGAGSAHLPLLTPRPLPLPRPRGCFAKMGGGGGGGLSGNMLFLKNPRVCTDAPLPRMLRSRARPRGGPALPGRTGLVPASERTEDQVPGEARRPFVPGPGEAGQSEQTRRALARRGRTLGHAHSPRRRVRPGPPGGRSFSPARPRGLGRSPAPRAVRVRPRLPPHPGRRKVAL